MGRPAGSKNSLTSRLLGFYLKLQRSEKQRLASLRLSNQGKRGMLIRWHEHRIIKHLPIVEQLAKQLSRMFPQVPLEDLISAGHVGLVEAANRVDPDRQANFSAYAWWRIRGAIIDANKRRQYHEAQHTSIESIVDRAGYLPAALMRDRAALPDELAEQSERVRAVDLLINELQPQESALMRALMGGISVNDASKALGMSRAWGRARMAEMRDRIGAGMILR